jgi:5-methylcytosine-specific restriction endonuclease McrA
VAVAPDLAYCLSNLVALSKPCHSRETARRRS